MKCKYEKDYIIRTSDCDHSAVMGIPQTFDLFMDMASIHAESLGIGMRFMNETAMFWLTAKTRVRFLKKPHMLQNVRVNTWPNKPRGVQTIRNYTITTPEGEVMAEGKTQWTVLNTKTGSLVRIDDVFPSGLDLLEDCVIDEPFTRMDEDIKGLEAYETYKVRSVDIDLGGHMNNVAYVRALFGTFSSKELDEMKISDCEVCYKHPCYEGDILIFYRKNKPDGTEIIVKNREGATVILAKLRSRED